MHTPGARSLDSPPSTWRDGRQRGHVRRAAKAKCRRKALRCLGGIVCFVLVVGSVLLLSVVLSISDVRNLAATNLSTANNTAIRQRHHLPKHKRYDLVRIV